MSILSNVPYRLNESQRQTAEKLEQFVTHNDHDVFIFSGYAGTGKTTMLRGLIGFLHEQKIDFYLMASTGRAAQVLSSKCGSLATTVHSTIYSFDDLEFNEKEKKRKLSFSLKKCKDEDAAIYIVDESSMIADKENTNQALLFENGKLLSHLFRYIGNRKVIFVGDPAQLPPVNSSFSAALNLQYITDTYGKRVTETHLTQIMRYNDQSGISWNGSQLRSNIVEQNYPPLSLKASGYPDISVMRNFTELIRNYINKIKSSGLDSAIIIAYTNKMAFDLNNWTRQHLPDTDKVIVEGEWLQVVFNNHAYDLANGQHITVKKIEPKAEYRAGITFRKAVVLVNNGDEIKEMEVRIMEDLLYDKDPSLIEDKEHALLADFFARMAKIGITQKHPSFVEYLRADEWLNAVRVKYGYVITCHKAQGGEWENVLIIPEYPLMHSPREFQYRWMYTAVTRTSEKLYLMKNDMIY